MLLTKTDLGSLFRGPIALLVATSMASPATAAVPLLRAPSLSEEAYAARLASRGSYSALVDQYSATSPTDAQTRALTSAFARAQSAFLESSVEDAQRGFREVTRMAREADWRDAQRRAISFSFMRLAQLAESTPTAEEKIEEAAAFAPDLNPDADAFPPPLVSAWTAAAARIKTKSVDIDLDSKFEGYESVKIDGREIAAGAGARVALSPGAHRVSALSNAHPYFSQILSATQLRALRIDQPALADGDCASPRLRISALGELGKATVAVAYPECVRVHGPDGWQEEARSVAVASVGAFPNPESGGERAPAWTKLSTKEPSPARGRKWIWATIGAVAVAGVAYAVWRAQQSSGSPSRSEGAATAAPTQAEGL